MENLVFGYIVKNYVLIVAMIGLWLSSFMNINLTKYMIRLIRECVIIIFSLSVIEYLEAWTATFETLSEWRLVFAALAYSLNPIMIMQVIRIMSGIRKYKLLLIPAIINIIISFSVFFSRISYYYTPDNQYHRGILSITPYMVSVFYVLVFLIMVMRYFRRNTLQENLIIIFISFNGLAAMYLHIYHSMVDIYNLLFSVDIILYFLFLHIQLAKRDQLTGLLNRQTFYNDINSYSDYITGIISIDMNELKWINDTKGHIAGDNAIKTVSGCFVDNVSELNRIYRVGGDEFVILCIKQSEASIREDMEKIRKALSASEYSCAIGNAFKSEDEDIEALYAAADGNMYEDKRRIKNEILANGGTLHSRK